MRLCSWTLAAGLLLATGVAHAQFTITSPTGGPLPSGVSKVGGGVDLKAANGNRVVNRVAASTDYLGNNPVRA